MEQEQLHGGVKACGVWIVEHWRDGVLLGVDETKNLIVNQGLNHILDVVLHGNTPVSPWYIGIFKGNYTPVVGVTGTTIRADSTESNDFTEGARVVYNEAAAASQVTTNSANKAVFTMNATETVYGAFLADIAAWASAPGTVLAATRFATSRAVISADVLSVTYAITAASA